MTKHPILILMGPPGCGKGTQGMYIAKTLDIPKISTGDLLRDQIASQTPLGKTLKAIMDKGELIKDEVVLELLQEKISSRSCNKGFILDGFPRNISQAESLMVLLKDLKKPSNIIAIDIAVSDQEVINRITNRYYCTKCKTNYNKLYKNPIHKNICDVCGTKNAFAVRNDDTKETVKNRLTKYYEKTSPLISHYKNQGILYTVQGDKNINEVKTQIDSILKTLIMN
ncbi:MAG: adenylate kinase [Rickettsiales bacterium]|nr:adenylate kinase [Rickettsiales bacterium]